MNAKIFTSLYKKYSQIFWIFIFPLVASLLPIFIPNKQALCGFVLIVMAGYWISECLPFAVVSLLPIPLFPLFGIMASKEVSRIYFSDILMLFFGGLVLALSVESTGLHKKVAFKVILFFGSNPFILLFGIMSVTGFLSMWISNVASASMMLPITIAIVKQLARLDSSFQPETNPEGEELTKNEEKADELPNTNQARKLMKCFLLALTYSSSIGGSGTLVGTAPNLILKGFFDEKYPGGGLNFFSFILYALPCSVLMLLSSWLILSVVWLPRKCIIQAFKRSDKTSKSSLEEFIELEYNKLGPLSWEQGSVGGFFIFVVILWVTRDLFFVPGWGSLFMGKFPSDTTPAILVAILLVAWPKENIFSGRPYSHLITWKKINDQLAWNIIILSGGGLALATGFEKSGLSKTTGDFLQYLMPDNKEATLLILVVFSFIITEFTSNTSTASILVPIADAIAKRNQIPAGYLLPALTLSASYSFMLPVATPTNAIVFGPGYLTIKDMMISGALLKIPGLLVLGLSTFWRSLIFNDKYTLSEIIMTSTNTTNLAT